MTLSQNITYRLYVEKLGATNTLDFVGDEGEYFYSPSDGQLRLSDGSTSGGQNMTARMIAFATAMGI